jgi:hypothetical protein
MQCESSYELCSGWIRSGDCRANAQGLTDNLLTLFARILRGKTPVA